jgi:hypothetical protein
MQSSIITRIQNDKDGLTAPQRIFVTYSPPSLVDIDLCDRPYIYRTPNEALCPIAGLAPHKNFAWRSELRPMWELGKRYFMRQLASSRGMSA